MADHLGPIGNELRDKAQPESGIDAHSPEDQRGRVEGAEGEI